MCFSNIEVVWYHSYWITQLAIIHCPTCAPFVAWYINSFLYLTLLAPASSWFLQWAPFNCTTVLPQGYLQQEMVEKKLWINYFMLWYQGCQWSVSTDSVNKKLQGWLASRFLYYPAKMFPLQWSQVGFEASILCLLHFNSVQVQSFLASCLSPKIVLIVGKGFFLSSSLSI